LGFGGAASFWEIWRNTIIEFLTWRSELSSILFMPALLLFLIGAFSFQAWGEGSTEIRSASCGWRLCCLSKDSTSGGHGSDIDPHGMWAQLAWGSDGQVVVRARDYWLCCLIVPRRCFCYVEVVVDVVSLPACICVCIPAWENFVLMIFFILFLLKTF